MIRRRRRPAVRGGPIMTRALLAAVVSSALWPIPPCGGETKEETIIFLAPGGKKFVPQTRVTLRQGKYGWSITSSTGGGEREMTVVAKYDATDQLSSAGATL